MRDLWLDIGPVDAQPEGPLICHRLYTEDAHACAIAVVASARWLGALPA